MWTVQGRIVELAFLRNFTFIKIISTFNFQFSIEFVYLQAKNKKYDTDRN
jgi:hypothetical protein